MKEKTIYCMYHIIIGHIAMMPKRGGVDGGAQSRMRFCCKSLRHENKKKKKAVKKAFFKSGIFSCCYRFHGVVLGA